VPAGESPQQPIPPEEASPLDEQDDSEKTARVAGRTLLQAPAGILTGAVGGVAGFFPSLVLSIVVCEVILESTGTKCLEVATYSGTAVGVSLGAGLGVMAVGYLFDGRARTGATLGGALMGSALGAAIGLLSGMDIVYMSTLLLVGPAVGATFLYALSDAYFPDPTRRVAPARKEKEEDEYVRVLPIISTTRTGGLIAGLVGRF
jgi:hypothetical protein